MSAAGHPAPDTPVERAAPASLRRAAPAGWQAIAGIAWLVTILVSAVPSIVFTELTGMVPGWVPVAQIAIVALLLVASFVVASVRPLRDFAVVMLALYLVQLGLPRLNLDWQPLQSLFGATVFDDRMQGEQAAKLVAALAMIGLLLLLGYRRRDMFLARGDSRAPIQPVPLLGFPRPEPWRRFGLQWGFYVAGALAVVYYLVGRPSGQDLAAVLPMLPSILFYAAINSFNEEMTYRAPMIATLEPSLGSTQAVWQAAVLFGVAHYFGMGLPGAVLSVFMGWLLGKAMVETRGLFWAWWIHFLSDIVIFVFLAATLV